MIGNLFGQIPKHKLIILSFIVIGLIIFFAGLAMSNASKSFGTAVTVFIFIFLILATLYIRTWIKNSE